MLNYSNYICQTKKKFKVLLASRSKYIKKPIFFSKFLVKHKEKKLQILISAVSSQSSFYANGSSEKTFY